MIFWLCVVCFFFMWAMRTVIRHVGKCVTKEENLLWIQHNYSQVYQELLINLMWKVKLSISHIWNGLECLRFVFPLFQSSVIKTLIKLPNFI